ncbi:MAG: CoA synthetase [Alphaproteobacteria bacterium]|nr:CoA synthetase [Alphaproteobacteria bacterium]
MPSPAFVAVDALAARIADGASLALPADGRGVAMAVARALVRRGARGLSLINVPTGGLQTDLLIGAGCAVALETSGVSLGEFGPAPHFTAAATAGTIALRDATCPAIHAGLQAAEKGLPFLPLRGILGTDVLAHRADWKVINNPFATAGDPIVLVPAISPDVALFHAPMADRSGNVWIGRDRDVITMAHAARTTLVTVERVVDGDLFADDTLAASTLSSFYITAIAEATRGAWPLALTGHYRDDDAHLGRYVEAAATTEGFSRYLDEFVFASRAAAQ